MIPCGEDLSVGFECVPRVMKKLNILGLRVVRWCRKWEKEGQPFVPLNEYEPLSVCTTSVHDSSTMREWMDNEELTVDNRQLTIEKDHSFIINQELSVFDLLKTCKTAESIWFIPPLQDLLYIEEKYWLPTAQEERINVPGTVNTFNWTYRIPATLEELIENEELCKKIRDL